MSAMDFAMRHIDVGFQVLRNTFPVLVWPWPMMGRRWAVVTRYDDVVEVFRTPDVFDVIYAPKIAMLMDGDNIFLGMSPGEEAVRDKSNLGLAAPRGEAAGVIGPRAAALADEVVTRARPTGKLDLAMELTQDVTTRVFGQYFGTPGTSVKEFSDQARLLFQYMFADLAGDAALEARARPVAAAMRTYVEGCIAARKATRGTHDDMLERCLRMQDAGVAGMDDRSIRNNLIGCITGGLPQPPMLVPQLFDKLLDMPDALAGAQAAARADDDALVAKYVFEAARFYPLAPGLFRDCTRDFVVAAGTSRARSIPKGTRVLAAFRSAMFDGRRVPEPGRFRVDRAEGQYIHFGMGMHECFGVHMNRALLPAICKPVLKLPGLRRAKGPEGRLRMEGIFPMQLTAEFNPAG